MRPLGRPQRIAVTIWIVVAIVVWNGVYDLLLGQGIKEYLFREALYHAGRGPEISIASVMDPFVLYATWVATLWTSVILLAGLFTIRLLSSNPEPRTPEPMNP